MSWTHLSDSAPVARKQYKCSLCGFSIPIGEKHVKRTGVSLDGLSATRMHVECERLTQSWDEDDWEYQDQYEFREALAEARLAAPTTKAGG